MYARLIGQTSRYVSVGQIGLSCDIRDFLRNEVFSSLLESYTGSVFDSDV